MPKLPEFKTEKELAEFADTHDTAAFWEEMTPVDTAKFRLRRRSQTAVRVPLSQATLQGLKSLAAERHVPLEELLCEWLSQRFQQESAIPT